MALRILASKSCHWKYDKCGYTARDNMKILLDRVSNKLVHGQGLYLNSSRSSTTATYTVLPSP